MSILDIRNLTKRYDDKLAVDNLNISVEEGDIFGLLGPNGAGKSTTISMICGLTKLDSGEILVNGHSIIKEAVSAKKSIGLVPQDIALYKNLNAIDNLKFWGTLYGLRGKVLKERISEVLEATGLQDRAKEKIANYSGGMKRRINIAAAVMHHPQILIMDEPTVGIDPQSRNHILEFTKDLNKKNGTTIIYTSHYMEEVEMLCNKLSIMDEGKVIASGTQEEVKRMVINEEKIEVNVINYTEKTGFSLKQLQNVKEVDYKDNKLSIVVKNSDTGIQNIIEVLTAENIKIRDISIKSPNLETVFLSLTGKSLRDNN